MKTRWALVFAAACVGLGLCTWLGASPAQADHSRQSVSAALVVGATAAEEAKQKYAYVGSRACKKCHISQHKSWAKTNMAKALETLEPGKAAEAKKKHGLDPKKDYTKDESCLKCHAVGFGAKGGYVIPDEEKLEGVLGPDAAKKALKQAVKDAEDRAGVGCESCHGPGEAYVEVFSEIMKSKRKYKVQELYDIGMIKPDEKNCVSCHNDKSATYDEKRYTYTDADGKEQTAGFHYEQAKDEDNHAHKPLKLRDDG